MIKLFPKVQSLYLDWDLELAETPARLLPQVTVSKASVPSPITMLPNLTELALNFSDMEWAAGFGGAEMTMLLRHLRLFNVDTLRLNMRVSDLDALESDYEWEKLENALKGIRLSGLRNVAIRILIPAYDLAEFQASVSTVISALGCH